MKSNDFDKLAFIYDQLARLVFGKSMVESQKHFLNAIPEGSRILILGGGTGWILMELLKIKKEMSVCYIEASAKMIDIAKARLNRDERIQFIHGTESDIPSDSQFDFIITNFYLDLFTNESLKIVIGKIGNSLAPQGKWIATDFTSNQWWHRVMLKVMYFFFNVTCNIESKKLPEWSKEFQAISAKQLDSKKFYGGFIQTTIFQV